MGCGRFPTRQYPYGSRARGLTLSSTEDPFENLDGATFVRFLLGQDDSPVPIETAAIPDHVNDPFAQIILAAGNRPQTLEEILALLDSATGDQALPEQRVYRVADGGQIPWSVSTATLDRHLRIVVTRHRAQDAEIFVSTAPPFDSTEIFLQVFAWDPKLGAYNFYERRRGIWSWAGSSWHALKLPTRGLGPFDSHVNGGPVMKELKIPWLHWHSQSATIQDDILDPSDPLRSDPFYHGPGLKGGEDLELVVRAGINRWTASRFAAATSSDRVPEFDLLARHLLTTTTVNLTCSPQQSAALSDTDILRLPTTFFLNSELLLDEFQLPALLPRLKVSAGVYHQALQTFGVQLQDGDAVLKQDAFFAFAVPEPSREDNAVSAELVRRNFVSRRLAVAMLMVDFPNPVYSARRAKLMDYVPAHAAAGDAGLFGGAFTSAVEASPAAQDPTSPEAELLRYLRSPEDTWEQQLAGSLEAYWSALSSKLSDPAGFEDVFRLAESRRRQFRKRPRAEFGLTLPVASSLALPDPLAMTADARVIPAAA
jgi:hypothetical protein